MMMDTNNRKFLELFELGIAIPDYWKDCEITAAYRLNSAQAFVTIHPEAQEVMVVRFVKSYDSDGDLVLTGETEEQNWTFGGQKEQVEIRQVGLTTDLVQSWVGQTIRDIQKARR